MPRNGLGHLIASSPLESPKPKLVVVSEKDQENKHPLLFAADERTLGRVSHPRPRAMPHYACS